MDFDFSSLDGVAGLAALVNSLLLWPVVRSLRATTTDHHSRLKELESKAKPKRRRRAI